MGAMTKTDWARAKPSTAYRIMRGGATPQHCPGRWATAFFESPGGGGGGFQRGLGLVWIQKIHRIRPKIRPVKSTCPPPPPKKKSTLRRKPVCHGSGVGREWPVRTGKPPEGGKLEDGKPPGGKPGAGVDGEGWIVTPPPPHLWVEGLGDPSHTPSERWWFPLRHPALGVGLEAGGLEAGGGEPEGRGPGGGVPGGRPVAERPPCGRRGGIEYPLGTGRRGGGGSARQSPCLHWHGRHPGNHTRGAELWGGRVVPVAIGLWRRLGQRAHAKTGFELENT